MNAPPAIPTKWIAAMLVSIRYSSILPLHRNFFINIDGISNSMDARAKGAAGPRPALTAPPRGAFTSLPLDRRITSCRR